jgi:hypothetical protein
LEYIFADTVLVKESGTQRSIEMETEII